MAAPAGPIGSIPRPPKLINGIAAHSEGTITNTEPGLIYESAQRETIERSEATGAPVIASEQIKPSFAAC
jgi:5-methyltetrahydropteroyltriglutamate--homocysteine methyltransferase